MQRQAGCELCSRSLMPPQSFASRNSLPPGGAAAPTVWQSQSHGPCLKGMRPLRSFASRNSLPPGGAAAPAVWQSQSRGPCLKGMRPPRSFASRNFLHLAGRRSLEASLLSPAVWRSQPRGPCLNGRGLQVYCVSVRPELVEEWLQTVTLLVPSLSKDVHPGAESIHSKPVKGSVSRPRAACAPAAVP